MFSEAFVCPQGGVVSVRGVSVQEGLCPGVLCLGGLYHGEPPNYGGRAGGMHPTGMHSCHFIGLMH